MCNEGHTEQQNREFREYMLGIWGEMDGFIVRCDSCGGFGGMEHMEMDTVRGEFTCEGCTVSKYSKQSAASAVAELLCAAALIVISAALWKIQEFLWPRRILSPLGRTSRL